MKRTIAMVKVGSATFVERDEKILRSSYDVRVFRFREKGLAFLGSCVQFLFWFLRHARSADILFTRFAHYHAFLLGLAGRLTRKPVVIVVGGSDAIWIPRLHYGVYDGWLSRHTTRWSLRLATCILPNHASLIRGVNSYSDPEPRPEGLLVYNPDVRTPVRVVHNGYDHTFWTPVQGAERRKQVLSVAPATSEVVFRTKGLDMLMRISHSMRDIPFTLVGVAAKDVERWTGAKVPDNMTLLPVRSAAELRLLYSSSAVFLHCTLTEGMPNVLCEAMLCECVPVASNVNSIPDIIGDTGFVVPRPDEELWTSAVRRGLAASSGVSARRRIIDSFPEERRKIELLRILDNIMNDSRTS